MKVLSIRRRLTLGFAALIGLFAVNVAFYFYSDGRRTDSFTKLNNALRSRLLVQDLDSSLADRRKQVRFLGVLATGGGDSQVVGDEDLDELLGSLDRMRAKARELRSDAADPEQGHTELVLTIEPLLDGWANYFRALNTGEPLEPQAAQGDAEETPGEASPPTDPATLEELAQTSAMLLSRLERVESQRVQDATADFYDVRTLTNQATIWIFAVTIVLALVVAIALAAYITRNLQHLEAGARRIGEGDLDHRIRLRLGDELGRLAEAFNVMAEKLNVASQKEAEARQAAEAANQAKSTFLANMSHELRTPMNAILGYSEMLVEEAEEEGLDDFVPDLRKIIAAGKHLLVLINDVLDLSKIEAGKMTLFVEAIPIDELLEDVIATVEPLVEKNGNRLHLDTGDEDSDGGLGTLHADETKVRQALYNLLSNSAKFTENGDVTLRVRRLEEHIRFQVQDSGIGMNPQQLNRVFDEFTQADASTTRKFGGTGLGLSISRKFCRLMGGDLYAESEEGVGSTFTLDLPLRVDPTTEDETVLSRLAGSGGVPRPS